MGGLNVSSYRASLEKGEPQDCIVNTVDFFGRSDSLIMADAMIGI